MIRSPRPTEPPTRTPAMQVVADVVTPKPRVAEMLERAPRLRHSASSPEEVTTSGSDTSALWNPRMMRYAEKPRVTTPSPEGPRTRPAARASPKFDAEEAAWSSSPQRSAPERRLRLEGFDRCASTLTAKQLYGAGWHVRPNDFHDATTSHIDRELLRSASRSRGEHLAILLLEERQRLGKPLLEDRRAAR